MPIPGSLAERCGRAFNVIGTVIACALILGAVLLGSGLVPPLAAGSPRAAGGVIDLRSWDFSRDGPVPLAGEWDFFPGKLLYGQDALRAPRSGSRILPDTWKGKDGGGEGGLGYSSYRLRVLLPPGLLEPAIRYTTVSTAFELEADGVPVASAGHPSEDPATAVPAYRPGIAALPQAESLDLVLRVSNFEYRVGGPWRFFYIGPERALAKAAGSQQALSYAESAALGALALSFVFFYLNRQRQRSFLFLALFLLSIALRCLVTGEYVLVRILPGLSFDALIRLEYVSVYFATPLGVLFFASLFPLDASRKGIIVVTAPYAALALLLPLAPLRLLTRSMLLVYPLAIFAIAATAAFVLIPAVLRKRKDSVLELVGGAIISIIWAHDMLAASFRIHSIDLLPLGLLAFVGIQSHVLARRFAAALDAAETLSAEKDILLREVHHRVKNSLQIVSSAIALQAHRTEDPAVIGALAAARARIRAISLVHEKLYALDEPGPVDLGLYSRDLARQLEAGYRRDEGRIELSVEAEPIRAQHDFCIDLGLVLAELLSNAYRHALAGNGSAPASRVSVFLRREGSGLLLRVEDDGPGFPPGFSLERSDGMGLKVASSLARKRGGTLSLGDRGPGAVIEFRMSIPGAKSRAANAKE